MGRIISIASWIVVAALLAVATGMTFLGHNKCRAELLRNRMAQQSLAGPMSESDEAYIMAELDRRAAADCVIETTPTGWVCIQQDGKKFFVHRR